ncbi:hypothetical protein P43SY_007295 [Pythium insidiosum]|uniref:Chromo domain-containing protein n=1 Tax=Pythium insidiosum TaxID=114742 RepID=A0AAD5LTM4_PYTIN|nr:hypothetical protein P43SY_007295 [Pythium insidiosum]
MEYVVEEIRGERRTRRKGRSTTKFLVKWAGYDEETWEPYSNLIKCRDKIEEFRSRQQVRAQDEKTDAEVSVEAEIYNDTTANDSSDKADVEEDKRQVEGSEVVGISEVDDAPDLDIREQNEGAQTSDDDGDEDGTYCDDAPIIVQGDPTEDIDEGEDAELCNALAGPHADLRSDLLRKLALDGCVDTYYGDDTARCHEDGDFTGSTKVSDAAIVAAKSLQPIDLFFFFLPKRFWRQTAFESNRYEGQTRGARMAAAKRRYGQKYTRAAAGEKAAAMEAKVRAFEPIEAHEILKTIGLLIARALCPMKTGLEHHWSTTQTGAVPRGTWSNNEHPNAKLDRAWKIRPVVETLQCTFLRGMTFGRWVAFDEMVIPSRSSRNSVRVYLKNKPHKYDARFVDTLSGPAAVVRNLKAIWPRASQDKQKRVIITDREYTCVSLAVRLSAMGFGSIGTVQPSRLGFPKALKYPFKSRCTKYPHLYACSWLDNKPVYFLASNVSTRKTAIRRKEKDGSVVEVECPEFIAHYNKYMNGVDAHDQLRLQRYSIQRSMRMKKYYQSLFLGLLDMAIVNAYIVHKQYCLSTSNKPLTHSQFKLALHEQLISLTAEDLLERGGTPPPSRTSSPRSTASVITEHHLEFADDKNANGRPRYRVCKVCSLLHDDPTKPIGKSRAYCVECSSEKARVYLCDRIRTTETGNQMTCFQIWHQHLCHGKARDGARKIRLRSSHTESACAMRFAVALKRDANVTILLTFPFLLALVDFEMQRPATWAANRARLRRRNANGSDVGSPSAAATTERHKGLALSASSDVGGKPSAAATTERQRQRRWQPERGCDDGMPQGLGAVGRSRAETETKPVEEEVHRAADVQAARRRKQRQVLPARVAAMAVGREKLGRERRDEREP